jgi:cyclopropane-fatty-acyl-phospholipid synthase
MIGIELAERGLIPAPLVRLGVRRLLRARIEGERQRHVDRDKAVERWTRAMAASEVAIHPQFPNQQHYEVPPEFFEAVLGRNLKYSSALWTPNTATLDDAEAAMLDRTCRNACIGDGQRILDLGCGWGSLSLWLAERYPRAHVTAVSNSAPQREFVKERAAGRGLGNIEVLTADMNGFAPEGRFDRVVSVEMFEHMRNWNELLRRIHGWLVPDGRLFVHVFTHRLYAYPFDVDGDGDWMARHFFTGGMMPSDDLLPRVRGPFDVEGHWVMSGMHYARTAEAWYANLLARRERVMAALSSGLAPAEAERQYHRWRIFFLACAELFGFGGGAEWGVSHYVLRPAGRGAP